jgi:hypothetical protein
MVNVEHTFTKFIRIVRRHLQTSSEEDELCLLKSSQRKLRLQPEPVGPNPLQYKVLSEC